MSSHNPDHFAGLSPQDHLKQARLKGLMASTEIHGMEMPGHISAFADAVKDTTMVLTILWAASLLLYPSTTCFVLMILFSVGWLIWKPARSALLGSGRLERLHRLIEEERWEIEHNREQEKLELTEMYRSKGFSGKLLEDVIDVLMSDENRLLQIMLEEELGLTLGIHEHPLRQAFGAALGVATAAIILISAFWISPTFGTPVAASFVLFLAAAVSAKLERNKKTSNFVWHLASFGLVACLTYIVSKLFVSI
jgi:hypothetical protein